jgi:Flp pilus assembly secretin CpaC
MSTAFNSKSLASLPIDFLVGAPFEAIYKSEYKFSNLILAYIKSVGLTKDLVTGTWKALNVEFEVTTNGETSSISTPILAIVPIPSFHITKADVDFSCVITSTANHSDEFKSAMSLAATADWDFWLASGSVSMNASMSYESTNNNSQSITSNYKFHVEGAQMDYPQGLTKLIEAVSAKFTAIQKPAV